MIKPNMGITNTTSSSRSLSDALFSGTKQRVLGILYGQPARSFYANELISLAASGSGAVQRELATLTHSGLRSEEHTSELQSLMRISYAVFCLKKKKTKTSNNKNHTHLAHT